MIEKEYFENYIATLFESDYVVKEAMNYSFLAKSKRLRPLLCLNMLADLNIAPAIGLPPAAALEMIHTYSLIHDDLPAFDDDDLRRGLPTCHKAFNEEVAILAGDGLLTESFGLVARSKLDDNQKVEIINLLSEYAGAEGMIKGQAFDMAYESETPTLEQLIEMDNMKTGRLLTLPFLIALCIANKQDQYDKFKKVGSDLGIAFQIQDDLLDLYASSEVTGKTSSDEDNNKTTYVSLMGAEKAQQYVDDLYKSIFDCLKDDYPNTLELLTSMQKRVW